MQEAPEIRLFHADASAEISLLGAEVRSWQTADGRSRLWSGDARWWEKISPVLFPICGWARGGEIRVGGSTYPMPVHGFASRRMFTPIAVSNSSATLRLESSEATRASYPFAFRFDVTYALVADALHTRLTVTNTGEVPLPYAVGVHPGFATGAAEGWSVQFAEKEASQVPVIAPGGLFSERTRPVAIDGRDLPLGASSFAQGAMCFLDARSRSLVLGNAEGGYEVAFDNLPHIVVWSRPGAPFVSIEGWGGYGDPADFDGDIADKPSMTLLAPGAEAAHAASYRAFARG